MNITGNATNTVMETTSKFGVVNEGSVSLKEDTLWEANENIGVASENKYSTHPVSSLNSKRKVSIPSEGIDPLEIFEETNMTESANNTMMETTSKLGVVNGVSVSLKENTPFGRY